MMQQGIRMAEATPQQQQQRIVQLIAQVRAFETSCMAVADVYADPAPCFAPSQSACTHFSG